MSGVAGTPDVVVAGGGVIGPDVVVAGGGVIGLSIAWRLSTEGVAVAVVDPTPGSGASWVAAGMLAPVTETHYGDEALVGLALASSRRYPQFVEELEQVSGMSCGYRTCGTLSVARDRDDLAVLTDLLAFQHALGLHAQRLTSRECRTLEPGLAPTVRGGVLAPDDHQVDARALVGALRCACERVGVTLVTDRVVRVVHDGAAVRGVELADEGVVHTSAVILAAGAWSATISGLPPEVVPAVRPVKGQLLHVRGPADAPLATRNIRGLDVYVVPRADGRVVVGASVEERGYDTQVTAGAVRELLRAAYELLPGIDEFALVETTAGLRPGTPDNAPLLGETTLSGLVVATGHHRNGVLLAPVTADAVSALITTGALPDVAAPFHPARFTQHRSSV